MTGLIVALLAAGGALSTPGMMGGDEEFARLEYARAEETYDSALAAAADSAQYLWRLSRLYVCMGDMAERERKEETYRTAVAYAERCIRADSTIAQGHTWKAAALGNIAMFEGSKGKVRLCNEIKRELDRAIALDSLDDVAYSILGSFYLALGKVGWFERQIATVFLGSLPDGGFEEAEAPVQLCKEVHDLLPLSGVQVSRWLVREYQFGARDDRPGDADKLLLPSRELARAAGSSRTSRTRYSGSNARTSATRSFSQKG